MAKDKWDKIKVISDVVKDNKLFVAMLFTSLGSMATNANQYMNNSDLEISSQQAVHDVAKGFQAVLAEKQDKPQVKVRTCSNCSNLIISHESRYHR